MGFHTGSIPKKSKRHCEYCGSESDLSKCSACGASSFDGELNNDGFKRVDEKDLHTRNK